MSVPAPGLASVVLTGEIPDAIEDLDCVAVREKQSQYNLSRSSKASATVTKTNRIVYRSSLDAALRLRAWARLNLLA